MSKYKYSILTFIVGKDYELVREIQNKQDDVEYILVTDVADLTSSTWNVVYDDSLNECQSPWEKCFRIRYDVFKYCSSDICITIDGSMLVKGSLDRLVQTFDDGGYDICLMPHPLWASMVKEYTGWVKLRGYPIDKANHMLSLMSAFGYHISDDDGLFQLCFSIKRRNAETKKLDTIVLSLLKTISGDGGFERLDQTWFTFIMNTQFRHMKVLAVSEQVVRSNAIQWYWHKTTNPNMNVFMTPGQPDMKNVFGESTECFQLID